MGYQDIGFDEFLHRIDPNVNQQMDPLQFDNFTDQIPGTKIQGGLISSVDEKVKLDLENGTFSVNNGIQNLVQLGVLPDGTVGLLINDEQGNALMQVSQGVNRLRTSTGNMEIDLENKRIVFYDEQNNPQAIFGII